MFGILALLYTTKKYKVKRESSPAIAVASCESDNQANGLITHWSFSFRKLLSLAVSRLLHIIRKSEAVTEAVEIEDTSQAHALHILKSLVHEGSLNHDIGLYLADILQASIENFNSTCWAIRNAALQLFGKFGNTLPTERPRPTPFF